MLAHTLMITTQKRAHPASTINGTLPPPKPVMIPLSNPFSCRIHFQISATTMGDSSTG